MSGETREPSSIDVAPIMARLANDGLGYLFNTKAAVEDVTALLREAGRLGLRIYAAYEQGHRDACEATGCALQPAEDAVICGLSGNYGAFQEPLACAYPQDHEGPHAWASLPTFVDGLPVGQVNP